MQQMECGLCGRRFMSDAEGAACPSCGVAAAHPVGAIPASAPEPAVAPVPAVKLASAAAVMDAVTTNTSGTSEEAPIIARSAEAQYAEAETQAAAEPPVSDMTFTSPAFAETAPAGEPVAQPLSSIAALTDAPTQAATPVEPQPVADARPYEAPTLPAQPFAAMAVAPEPAQAPAPVPPPDLAATQQATPIPPVAAPPYAAPTPPEQQQFYTPTPERPAMPAGYPVAPTPAPMPPNPYPPAQAPGAAYGYSPQPPVGYPPAQPPMTPVMQPPMQPGMQPPMQPGMQPPMGYPPAQPAVPSLPYGYAPQPSQPLQPGMTPMAPVPPVPQPPFAAPYGAPGGPPTYPGMMAPPQPPEKRNNGKMIGIIAAAVAIALVLGFAGVLALKGGSHGGAASATATPTTPLTASQILAKSQAFKYTDATYTMSMNFDEQGQSIAATGSGKVTTNPPRSELQMSFPLTISGTTYNLTFDQITDGNNTYEMISSNPDVPGFTTGGKWKETTSSASSSLTPFDPSQFANVGGVSNATLVGPESKNGVSVWHLKGQDTTSADGGAIDYYVRQDTYQPVEMDVTVTGATSGNVSIIYTGFNTGVTITVPSPDQVTQG